MRDYPTIEQTIGRTPLVRLQRLAADAAPGSVVLAKLEGTNPAGSVKDRPALSMFLDAERSGRIKPGDTVIEATSGNTGIALAMVAAVKGYRMILVMPGDLSVERAKTMTAYGAELVLTEPSGSMELARTTADAMESAGEGIQLDQFANPANPAAHIRATADEIWEQTGGEVTHFVSSMGTTGTITGAGRRLRELGSTTTIIGVQPEAGSRIPGIRAWKPEFLPRIFDPEVPHEIRTVNQTQATQVTRELARLEGIFAGMSAGGAAHVALEIAREQAGATVVFIVPDRGDRYLSTDLFS